MVRLELLNREGQRHSCELLCSTMVQLRGGKTTVPVLYLPRQPLGATQFCPTAVSGGARGRNNIRPDFLAAHICLALTHNTCTLQYLLPPTVCGIQLNIADELSGMPTQSKLLIDK